jgi:peptidoglycan/LPS O-acetylase OafA/YrhL
MTVRQEVIPSGTTQSKRSGFRPDIEGLRAVAVIAVVLYHAGIPGDAGGYIGVDVFFVISGFLITGLLWREVATTNTVALGRFYGARARRLLPAAATVGIATAIGAAIVLPPLQARNVFVDGVASALYVGNYRFAQQGTDYLAADLPSPFQHYWSLGVEEQFYLVWPMLIIGTAWLIGRLRPGAMARALPYALVLGLVGVASLTAAMLWTRISPSWAFFSLPTRAWELAAGGLVALSIEHWRKLPLLPAAIAGCGGLTLILLTCTQLGPHTPYPGTAALLPVLGTALVIGGGTVTGSLGPGRLLCRPAMRAIGRISYSWYLWHWPVLLLLPQLLGEPAGLPARLSAIFISAGLAVITLHLVENPGRFAAALRRSAKTSLAVAGAATGVAACACLLLLAVIPVPAGHGPAAATANIVALPSATVPGSDPHAVDPREAAVRDMFAQVRDAVAASAGLRAVPSNLDPSLADAPADKAAVFVNGCVRSWRDERRPDRRLARRHVEPGASTARRPAALAAGNAGQGDLPAAGPADRQPVSGPGVHRVRTVARPDPGACDGRAPEADRGEHEPALRSGLRLHLLRPGLDRNIGPHRRPVTPYRSIRGGPGPRTGSALRGTRVPVGSPRRRHRVRAGSRRRGRQRRHRR